ncbi:MAG TPA: MucR family transcriptional regulator [Novosphingobium sp.]|nr:MucR family transcriptional regulator [Novosphingobium sp.]
MAENSTESGIDFIAFASEITIAWLQNPNVNPDAQDVLAVLRNTHAALASLGQKDEPEPEVATFEPAVPVRSSVKADYLVSLIDGRKFKSLKRHLAQHGLTPDEYRQRYGLKADYPMVAENYAAARREIAVRLGLGRKAEAEPAELVAEPEAKPAKRAVSRKPEAAAPEAPAIEVKAKRPGRKPKAALAEEAVAAPAPAKRGRPKKSQPEPAGSQEG